LSAVPNVPRDLVVGLMGDFRDRSGSATCDPLHCHWSVAGFRGL